MKKQTKGTTLGRDPGKVIFLFSGPIWAGGKLQGAPGGQNLALCCLSQSVMSDSVIPWTVAHQASLSMGFSRQEY